MLSIILGAIALFIFGALWYTVLVGNLWFRLMDFSDPVKEKMKNQGMAKPMFFNFILNLIVATAVYMLMSKLFVFSFWDLLRVVLIAWAGFNLPTYVNQALWEGKTWKVTLLNSVYSILYFLIVASVIYWVK